MPSKEMNYCDCCNKELTNEKYYIYKISYWNNKYFNKNKVDYLKQQFNALMLCSKECIGIYISNLLNGVKSE